MKNREAKKHDDGNEENNTERNLFSRLTEYAIVFFLCCGLIKIGISYLASVKVPLIIIAIVVGVAVIGYRIWKWRREHDDY